MRGSTALFFVAALAATAAGKPPQPVAPEKPKPFFDPDHALPYAILFCGPRALPKVHANARPSLCPVRAAASEDAGLFKRGLLGLERLLVTITQGGEMADAAVEMQKNQLHFYDNMKKNARKFTDTLKRRIEPSTASLADAYDMPLTPTPEQAAWRKRVNTPLFARNVPAPRKTLAKMGDCYGDFSSELSFELSGGYNEGAGDDLKMEPGFNTWRTMPKRISKYTERELRERYGNGLRDQED